MQRSLVWGLLCLTTFFFCLVSSAHTPPDIGEACRSYGDWAVKKSGGSAWVNFNSSNLAVLKNTFYNDFYKDSGNRTTTIDIALQDLESKIAQSKVYSKSVHEAFNVQSRALTDFPGLTLSTPAGYASTLPLRCSRCGSAIRELFRFMDIRYLRAGVFSGGVSLPTVTKKILTREEYRVGLLRSAKIVLLRVKEAENTGSVSSDIFSDIDQGYKESGFSEERNVEMAWDILGLYSTQGAFIEVLRAFASNENVELVSALKVIAYGMGYLDGFGKGRYYSYPPNLTTACKFGKPYHFWMAGYLARHLIEKGFTPRTAFLSVHQVGSFYEFASPTNDRGSEGIWRLTHEDIMSPYHQGLRAGIAFKGAGALFGLQTRLNSKPYGALPIDRALLAEFVNAKPPSKVDNKKMPLNNYGDSRDLRHWFQYLRVIAPDSVLPVYKPLLP